MRMTHVTNDRELPFRLRGEYRLADSRADSGDTFWSRLPGWIVGCRHSYSRLVFRNRNDSSNISRAGWLVIWQCFTLSFAKRLELTEGLEYSESLEYSEWHKPAISLTAWSSVDA